MKDVLIIDQTLPVRVRLVEICKSLNLRALEASDSSSAMNLLNKHQKTIGFIIMEIKFDQFDGFALLDRIKRQYETIPVMILTSSNKRSDFIYGLKSGALDYVLKPFDDIHIVSRITKLLYPEANEASSGGVPNPSINIQDMIQVEIKKAQKGHYVFVLFMLIIYKPLDTITIDQDMEYRNYLNLVYPEVQELFWETDHLTKFGPQLILGILPFCDNHGFDIVKSKIESKLRQLQSENRLPNDFHWTMSCETMPGSSEANARSVLEALQTQVRSQISLTKRDNPDRIQVSQ